MASLALAPHPLSFRRAACRHDLIVPVGCPRPRPFLALIHRSAWKGNSANSAFRGFSEIRAGISRVAS